MRSRPRQWPVMARAGAQRAPVTWQLMTTDGPCLAHHVACVILDKMYVHGGINKTGSATPNRELFVLDLKKSDRSWRNLGTVGAPALSHHACAVVGDRYMLVIGGWDGMARTSDVTAYDTVDDKWMRMETSGFATGGGLSSHTATPLEDCSILVLGREGSLRVQKRYGNAYILRGDVTNGVFKYTEHAMSLGSRSGHTTCPLSSRLYIIGGRADDLVEVHRNHPQHTQQCALLSELTSAVRDMPRLKKLPSGRKQHVTASGHGVILMHGGETFDGPSRGPVSEIFLFLTQPHLQYFKINIESDVARAGHVCCVTSSDVIIHGGIGPGGVIHRETYKLMVNCECEHK